MALKISVVIPAINEAESIGRSIKLAWDAGADEVVVADGGSDDSTVNICQQSKCKVVVSEPGRGVQLNHGVRASTGEVVLFLHADNWLVAGAIDQIRKRAGDTEFVFGGFQQTIQDDRRVFRWIESGNALRVKWRGLLYGDQAMFVSRQLFDSLGGFTDSRLMEDLDFSRRAKRRVWPVLLPGPTWVDARRWQKNGVVRQTMRNWYLATAFMLGADPDRLANSYRRHDA